MWEQCGAEMGWLSQCGAEMGWLSVSDVAELRWGG